MSFYTLYFHPAGPRHKTRVRASLSIILLLLALISVPACTSIQPDEINQITVQGRAVYMGNVPFNELILTTDQSNSYILKMDRNMLDSLMTPTMIRVKGIVSRGEWNGKAYAEIRVLSFQSVE